MKKIVIVGASVLLASAAAAQELKLGVPIVMQVQVGPIVLFEMQDGSCMKGPIIIRQIDGKEAFKLEKDVWYPAGCQNNPDAWKSRQ